MGEGSSTGAAITKGQLPGRENFGFNELPPRNVFISQGEEEVHWDIMEGGKLNWHRGLPVNQTPR